MIYLWCVSTELSLARIDRIGLVDLGLTVVFVNIDTWLDNITIIPTNFT